MVVNALSDFFFVKYETAAIIQLIPKIFIYPLYIRAES